MSHFDPLDIHRRGGMNEEKTSFAPRPPNNHMALNNYLTVLLAFPFNTTQGIIWPAVVMLP